MKKILVVILVVMGLTQVSQAQEANNEFKPSGKVWGYAMGDIFYKLGGDTMLGTYSGAEFGSIKEKELRSTFRRIYFGYEYNIAPNFTAKILFEGSDGVLTTDGKRTVFIKGLDLEWKNLIPRSSIFIGQTATPTWSLISEKVWSYRSVEKTIADFRKLGLSNDVGIRITGKFDKDGMLGYTVMWGTGKAEKPEDNSMKRSYVALDGQFFAKKLIVSLNADYEDASRYGGLKSNMTFLGFVAYQHEKFAVGVEGVMVSQKMAKTHSDLTNGGKDTLDRAVFGMSGWVRGTLIKDKLFGFARYDMYNPDQDYKMGDNTSNPYDETFITAGFDYTPHKNIHIIPNIWTNAYKDKRESTAAAYYERDPDVVVRLTFYYIFK